MAEGTPGSPSTLREARAQYFERNHFGNDGGYNAKWVKLKTGPFAIYFPNTKARVRAVKFHDLHHVLTGYDTNWIGEAEIGAWEVASGCGRHYPAWVLNLQGMAIGLFLNPRRVYAAFIRGRQSSNLYARTFSEELLGEPVPRIQTEMLLDRSREQASPMDNFLFAASSAVALGMLAWPLWLAVAGLLLWYLLR